MGDDHDSCEISGMLFVFLVIGFTQESLKVIWALK